MEPNTDRSNKAIKTALIVIVLILIAGLAGWQLGKSNKPANNQTASTAQPTTSTPDKQSAQGDVKSLVSYTLPDGWTESKCPSAGGSVYIVPAGADPADCSANPSSPVKISIDPGNAKDCNQLQNVQNVKKHICSSIFIDGRKTLKAFTEYNQESSFKKDTSISAYYLDTGKGVVKAEYIYNGSNDYEAGFDQLANSIKAKS